MQAIDTKENTDSTAITIHFPLRLYVALQQRATDDQVDLPEKVIQLVAYALDPTYMWQQDWKALCDLVQQEGGLGVPHDKEELIEHMRKIRAEIWEEEYAHLYR